MMGRGREGEPDSLKDENGRALNTVEEVGSVFRNRLKRTFNIREEENEDFCEETERRVETWVINNEEKLTPKETVIYEDTPEVTPWLIKDILKSFKERTPGMSGITRNVLMKAHENVLHFYSEIFTACLAIGYFPKD